MRRLRLLALVQKRVGVTPGQRFRLEQWAPHLSSQHAIELDFSPFESPALTDVLYEPGHYAHKSVLMLRDAARRADVLRRARDYDGVVIYREVMLIGPAIYERALATLGVPLFLDFDDAIWLPNVGSSNGVFAKLRSHDKTDTICRLSRAISVGNEYLADYARARCSNVSIVRTSIDLARNPLQPRPEKDAPLTIGWTGSKSTLVHLELARDFLEALARRRRVRLRVVCSDPAPDFAGVETEFVRWTAEREAADLGGLHVGIMPLDDDPSARGKCACKALQFMAVGCPTIVAPVGMNNELVRHGENGFLARTTDEWVAAAERLYEDRELAARVSAAGRQTVEDGFSAERSAERFAAMIRAHIA